MPAVPAALELEHLVPRRRHVRARRSAKNTASVPVLWNDTASAQGTIATSSSASRIVGSQDHQIAGAVVQMVAHRRDDRRMRVPEEHRARAEQVVDVLLPRDAPHAAALAALDHEVEIGRQLEEAEPAAGEVLARVGEERGLS